MIKKILCFVPFLIAGVLVSCTKERPVYVDREFDPSVIETTFIASDFTCTNELAKASLTDKGVLTWAAGDEVYYFSDAAARKMDKVAFAADGKTPSVLLTHNSGSKYVAAYYPGEKVSDPAIKDYTLKSFTCPGINNVQKGVICCPAVAYAEINDDTRYMNLTLRNVCSAIQISLPEGNEIDKVVLSANEKTAGNEINGAFKLDITAAPAPVFTETYDGKAGSQYETTVNTGKKAGTIYINVLPCTLQKGFTLSLYSGSKVQNVKYDAVAAFTPGRIHTLGDPTVVPAEPETFKFTTNELGISSGWTPMEQDPAKAEGNPKELYTTEASFGDLAMSVPANPGGSQNGYVTASYTDGAFSYSGWRFYMARNSGTLVMNCKSGRNIKTVKFTYSNKNGGVIKCGDAQINNGAAYTFTDISSTRTFTCASTSGSASGQYTITEWEITVQ